ncbi:type I-E CRISPR-associated protein Cse2/CasB, partial [Thermus scotoductus]|uniref:type I-E CRISPR-associated protein Cse2/CasB n=1 Tax=Thermus scotoductus TaxID=37636 RepID=UPI000F803C1F
LRQAVGLVEGALDFAQLLEDLLRWFDPKRRVQARWAREFYGAQEFGQEALAEGQGP